MSQPIMPGRVSIGDFSGGKAQDVKTKDLFSPSCRLLTTQIISQYKALSARLTFQDSEAAATGIRRPKKILRFQTAL